MRPWLALASSLVLLGGGKADKTSFTMSAGVLDFSNCTMESGGRCCMMLEQPTPVEPKPRVVECVHKQVETCHYTYVTLFTPHQERVCSDNYRKKCTIVFVTRSSPETVRKCYRPLEQDCSQEGSQTCRSYLESTCTTRYTSKAGGGSLGDTSCSREPRELCGAGCRVREGREECHDKQVDSVTEEPEEQCELSPQELCHQVTRLVPRLAPQQQCALVPREVCRPLDEEGPPVPSPAPLTKWCLDGPGEQGEFGEPRGPKQLGEPGAKEDTATGPVAGQGRRGKSSRDPGPAPGSSLVNNHEPEEGGTQRHTGTHGTQRHTGTHGTQRHTETHRTSKHAAAHKTQGHIGTHRTQGQRKQEPMSKPKTQRHKTRDQTGSQRIQGLRTQDETGKQHDSGTHIHESKNGSDAKARGGETGVSQFEVTNRQKAQETSTMHPLPKKNLATSRTKATISTRQKESTSSFHMKLNGQLSLSKPSTLPSTAVPMSQLQDSSHRTQAKSPKRTRLPNSSLRQNTRTLSTPTSKPALAGSLVAPQSSSIDPDPRKSSIPRVPTSPPARSRPPVSPRSQESGQGGSSSPLPLPRPTPSTRTVMAREFSSPSSTFPSPSSTPLLIQQKEGKIGHWIQAPPLFPLLPPLPGANEGRKQQSKNKGKNDHISTGTQRPRKAKTSRSKSQTHSYLPQVETEGDLRPMSLPPSPTKHHVVHHLRQPPPQFSVILPPSGGRVGSVMLPPPSLTLLSPPLSIQSQLPLLTPINGTFTAKPLTGQKAQNTKGRRQKPRRKKVEQTSASPVRFPIFLPQSPEHQSSSGQEFNNDPSPGLRGLSVSRPEPRRPKELREHTQEQKIPKHQGTQNKEHIPGPQKSKDHRTENRDRNKPIKEPRKPNVLRTDSREHKESAPDPRKLDEDLKIDIKGYQKNRPENQWPKKFRIIQKEDNGPRKGNNWPKKHGKDNTEPKNSIQQDREPKEDSLVESAEAEPSPEPEPIAGVAGEDSREKAVSGEGDTSENTVPGAGGQEDRQSKVVKPGRKKGYLPLPGSGKRKGRKGGWRGRQGGRRKQGRVGKNQQRKKPGVKTGNEVTMNEEEGARLIGEEFSLDLPELPLSSPGQGRRGRKYEEGLALQEEEEQDLPFYTIPKFSALPSYARPLPQSLGALAGLNV